MKHTIEQTLATFFLFSIIGVYMAPPVSAAILFESGTLGSTGVPWSDLVDQTVLGVNIKPTVFNGVRFELTEPVVTTKVGGHFAAPLSSNFFGALVKLDDENDFPDSGDLTTPDVLGTALLTFPELSNEVFGDLTLALGPGWYALIFGSGLFEATGSGGAPMNNPDIGLPTYIGFQSGAPSGWGSLSSFFGNLRFVVEGTIVPEPSAFMLALTTALFSLFRRKSCRR